MEVKAQAAQKGGKMGNLMSWDQAQLSLCVSLGKGLPIFILSVVFLMKSGDRSYRNMLSQFL